MIWNYYYHPFSYLFSLSTLIVLIFIKKYTIFFKISNELDFFNLLSLKLSNVIYKFLNKLFYLILKFSF